MLHINWILQISTATLLVLVCMLLYKYSRGIQNAWTGIGFTLGVLCYVVVESEAAQSVPFIRIVASLGAICIPVFYWLLARAIFDDHFNFRWPLLGWFLVILGPHSIFFVDGLSSWPGLPVIGVLARLTSLGFVLAGLYAALGSRKGDLVDSRIRFRSIFLYGTAALIGVTLIVELIQVNMEVITALQILQRIAILSITLYFLVSNFVGRQGYFFKESVKPTTATPEDPQLSAKLQALMEEQRVYTKEGLTISQLADVMNEQEYRVRRLINGQLGFRNFNDFLNRYRVNEACEVLSDPTQNRKTILEVAYGVGYQSIGPFNKAFKELKGCTPTEYRKSQLG